MAMVLEGREAFVTEQSKREKNSWRGPRPPSSPPFPSLLLLLLLQKVNPDPSTSLLLASLASSLQGEWSCRRGLASV